MIDSRFYAAFYDIKSRNSGSLDSSQIVSELKQRHTQPCTNFIINNNYYRRVGRGSHEAAKFACALIPFRLRARQSYFPCLADGSMYESRNVLYE